MKFRTPTHAFGDAICRIFTQGKYTTENTSNIERKKQTIKFNVDEILLTETAISNLEKDIGKNMKNLNHSKKLTKERVIKMMSDLQKVVDYKKKIIN